MRLFVLIPLCVVAMAAPTVSNISTVRKSHSTVTLRFDMDTLGTRTRVRYGLTNAYEGAGAYPDSGIQTYNLYDLNASLRLDLRVSGLSPNTLYHFCPQVSDDGGSTWSTCVDHTETTDAIPAGIHPAYPVAPTAPDTARPNTAGYTARSVASNCSDLQTKINDAASNINTAGSVISIPAGTVCTGIYYLPPPTVKTWSAGNVNTATSEITLTGHGLNDNDQVWIASTSPIASAGPNIFRQHRGFPSGNVYYARVIDPNTIKLSLTSGGAAIPFTFSTFTVDSGADTVIVPSALYVPLNDTPIQVVTTTTLPAPLTINTTYYVISRDETARTFKMSTTLNGSAIDITTTGTGTHSLADQGGTGKLLPYPLTANKIIITSTGFPLKEGVRVTPEWAGTMAKIKPSVQTTSAIYADDLAHNYRFEGIEFTHTDSASAEIATTINPTAWFGFMQFQRATSNIILDRCYVHGLGFPNRVGRAFVEFNGMNSAIINSYLEDLDFWTPNREGMELTRNSNTQFTVATGTFHLGPTGSKSINSLVTVDTSGAATGTVAGKVYLTMGGALTLDLPTGVSATCSAACSILNSAAPGFPVNGNGASTVMPIGNLSFTGANLTAVSAEDLRVWGPHQWTWEGASPFIAGDIGGRTALINNHIAAMGISIHYDDANGNQGPTGTDYTIRRNLFTAPLTHIWSRAETNKLRYGQRQQLEFKNGQRIKISGNIFEHVQMDVTAIANAIAISATAGVNASITDVELAYNIFRDGSGTYAILGGRPHPQNPNNAELKPAPTPIQRVWVHDNLAYNINQYTWRGYTTGNADGRTWDHRYPIEDLRIEHNTFYDLRGTSSNVQTLATQGIEGLRVADNIVWINGGSIFSSDECVDNIPSCAGDGFALLEDFTYDYTWTNNSFIAGWTSESGVTPRSSKTYITAALTSGTDAYLQSEWATDGKWYDAANGDVRLSAGSTHQSGGAKNATDGMARGVNYDRLRVETGEIYNLRNIGTTVYATVPDLSVSCYVGYGASTNPLTWAWTAADTTASRIRGISASGLTAGMYYRLVCADTYQPASAVAR